MVVLFFISAVLFFMDRADVFAFTFNFLQEKTVGPIVNISALTIDKTGSLFESFFLVRSLSEDFDNIKEDRNFYRGEYFKLKSVDEENEFLRQALNIEGGTSRSLVLADVITFDPLRSSDFLTINKGSRDGIKTGQPVILTGEILVGQVYDVSEETSRILLITSEDSSVPSTLERSLSNAIAKGSASDALVLELVLKNVELQPGEIVLTSGLGGEMPKNLLVGEISKILSEEAASFKEAVVRPFFSSKDLRQVFIIQSNQ